jgi:biotin transport system substrate-specific component
MHLAQTFEGRRTLAARVALTLAGSLLLALGARLSFEIGIVPITFQPLALALLPALLGPRIAFFAALAYLIEGASGLPVFAGGAFGPLVLAGPTGGYLLSYPIAAYVVGILYERGARRNVVARWFAQVAGLAIVYALGAAQLAAFVGPQRAIALGVVPFVALDLAKLGLVAFLPGRVAPRLER